MFLLLFISALSRSSYAAANAPFLLYVAPTAPHRSSTDGILWYPPTPAKQYANLYSASEVCRAGCVTGWAVYAHRVPRTFPITARRTVPGKRTHVCMHAARPHMPAQNQVPRGLNWDFRNRNLPRRGAVAVDATFEAFMDSLYLYRLRALRSVDDLIGSIGERASRYVRACSFHA